MRALIVSSIVAFGAVAAPVLAQTPLPHASPAAPHASAAASHPSAPAAHAATPAAHKSPVPAPRKTPFMTFTNPGHTKSTPSAMSGKDCVGGRGSTIAQSQVGPPNGGQKSQTLVSVPLGKDAGTVQNATARKQLNEACR